MRMQKGFAIIAAALLCSSIGARARDNGSDGAIHFHSDNVTMIIHQQSKRITLNATPAVTYLDKLFSINCLSAHGCLVAVQSQAQAGWSAQGLCTYLDGSAMPGACSPSDAVEIHNLQSELVSEGKHTLQTQVSSDYTTPDKVCPCEINYSIYEGE